MPRGKWTAVNVRRTMFDFINYLIEKYPTLGYENVGGFVRAAIRKLLREELERLGLPAAGPPSLQTDPLKLPSKPKLDD